MKERLENLFLQVQKPARYTGGELNSVTKNKDEVAVRFAFCFPDLYEVVNNGQWTIDKIVELTKDIYRDLNNNGKVDTTEDLFGYLSDPYSNLNAYSYYNICKYRNLFPILLGLKFQRHLLLSFFCLLFSLLHYQ